MLKFRSTYLSLITASIVATQTSCSNDNDSPELPNVRGEITLNATEQKLINSQNQFAFDLVKGIEATGIDDDSKNVIISPLSASYCLGMIAAGAQGATLEQITDVLGPTSSDEINGLHGRLIKSLQALDRTTTATLVNSMWIDNSVAVKEQYRDHLTTYYDNSLYSINLHEQAAVEKINRWCADNTGNLIPTIIEDIPSGNLLLVNTLHFESKWTDVFHEAETKAHTFHNADNSKSTVKMMYDIRQIEYKEIDGAQVARLTYGNGAYSMMMMLPAEGQDVNSLLTPEKYAMLTAENGMEEVKAIVEIPRFDMTKEVSLNQPLSELGMKLLFSTDADLSGMTESAMPSCSIVQKCRIIVDEGGTKAASTTSTSVDIALPPEYKITLDRPFAFIIQEQSTGLILFIGKINNL